MSRRMVGRNSQGPNVVGPTPGPWTGKGWPEEHMDRKGHPRALGRSYGPTWEISIREDASGLISIQEENIPFSFGPKIEIIGENHVCNDTRNTGKGPSHKVTFIP